MSSSTSMSKEAFLKKDEKERLAEKIGFMKSREISEEMEMLRKLFGGTAMKFPTTDSKSTRKLFDSSIGQLNDELVLMRNQDREEE